MDDLPTAWKISAHHQTWWRTAGRLILIRVVISGSCWMVCICPASVCALVDGEGRCCT